MKKYVMLGVLLIGTGACENSSPERRPDIQTSPANPVVPTRVVPPPAATVTIENVGFASPETVLWDSIADVYLVSNINGNPTAADDNGFISRLNPDGRVDKLKWIAGGTPGVTLHAPKGMAMHGDTLFVADVGGVRLFHRTTGSSLGVRSLATSGLNGITRGTDGMVYTTDLEQDAPPPAPPSGVYRLTATALEPVVRGGHLRGPDGIVVDAQGILIAPFRSKELLRLDSVHAQSIPAVLPGGKLDGLVSAPGGGWYVTSWDSSAVYHVAQNAAITVQARGIESPAQLDVDTRRMRLIIPSMKSNSVVIRPILP